MRGTTKGVCVRVPLSLSLLFAPSFACSLSLALIRVRVRFLFLAYTHNSIHARTVSGVHCLSLGLSARWRGTARRSCCGQD